MQPDYDKLQDTYQPMNWQNTPHNLLSYRVTFVNILEKAIIFQLEWL